MSLFFGITLLISLFFAWIWEEIIQPARADLRYMEYRERIEKEKRERQNPERQRELAEMLAESLNNKTVWSPIDDIIGTDSTINLYKYCGGSTQTFFIAMVSQVAKKEGWEVDYDAIREEFAELVKVDIFK